MRRRPTTDVRELLALAIEKRRHEGLDTRRQLAVLACVLLAPREGVTVADVMAQPRHVSRLPEEDPMMIEVLDAETNDVIGTTDDPALVQASCAAGHTGIVLAFRAQPRGPWRYVPLAELPTLVHIEHDVRRVYLTGTTESAATAPPTKMQIRILHSSDWGVDHAPDDVTAYEAAVTARVLATYPAADVTITEHLGSIRVRVYDCPETEEDEVSATVKSIAQAVWDDAAFWPAEVTT